MRETVNECCGCAAPGYPCRGKLCPNRAVLHISCDKCGDEDEDMYCYDGKDLCGACMLTVLCEKGVIEAVGPNE